MEGKYRKMSIRCRQLIERLKIAVKMYAVPQGMRHEVYYGGGYSGDIGGGPVKVMRLRDNFGEARFGFNVVYNLSNWSLLDNKSVDLLGEQGVPIVHNQNGTFYPAWYNGDWKWENKNMRIAYRAASYVFFQSEFCKRAAELHLGKCPCPNEILYNAVDLSLFYPAKEAPKSRPFTFLLTGKFNAGMWYRIHAALKALRCALDLKEEFKLVIGGWMVQSVSRSMAGVVEKYKLTNNVKYIGRYSQAVAPQVYRDADAYIMLKHQDPCPNTVIEAMASGLPVLYSGTGGVPELVGSRAGVGLACPESWEKAYVPETEEICRGMIRIRQECVSLGRQARIIACEKYDIKNWVNRHREIFDLVLN